MKGRNVLFIMSDEHSKRVAGCYGNPVIRTPHIDRLAEQGTMFTDAYANCPICVPSRASFATGRYVHQIGFWDNGMPYDGSIPGWGHHLIADGHEVVSIGKLHYRSTEDQNGFSHELLPLHVLEGRGDVQGMLRRPPPRRASTRQLAGDAGEGESTYIRYDRQIRDAAIGWLQDAARSPRDKPWVLFVSFVCPHFPLMAPAEFFRMYPLDRVPMPGLRQQEEFPDHPVLRKLREVQDYEDHFRDEAHVRTAIAAYYGMVSFLDDNIGRILAALEESGLAGDTLVVYTSDHGDNLGTRTFWGKSNMYEESVGVPLVMRGPSVPRGHAVDLPVSLVDGYQTFIEAAGVRLSDDEIAQLPGHSLLRIANGERPERNVLSEYHAVASITGVFMIRVGRYKYVHYEGFRPQLYDLQGDPLETTDLALDPTHAGTLATCARALRGVVDPAAVTARAFADQSARIAALGGPEQVMRMGNYPYTPAPGEDPRYADDLALG
jgi:choline-sulfatase